MGSSGVIRAAEFRDIDAVAMIYERIHAREQKGEVVIGWLPGVYPVRETALKALERGDLYVYEQDGRVLSAAVINHIQVPEYVQGAWKVPAKDEEVLVLHTLVVDPEVSHQGIGRRFVEHYETTAAQLGCKVLRMDTNARNVTARGFYAKLGYEEIGIVPCEFNGIPGVQLVLLEKAVNGGGEL